MPIADPDAAPGMFRFFAFMEETAWEGSETLDGLFWAVGETHGWIAGVHTPASYIAEMPSDATVDHHDEVRDWWEGKPEQLLLIDPCHKDQFNPDYVLPNDLDGAAEMLRLYGYDLVTQSDGRIVFATQFRKHANWARAADLNELDSEEVGLARTILKLADETNFDVVTDQNGVRRWIAWGDADQSTICAIYAFIGRDGAECDTNKLIELRLKWPDVSLEKMP